MAHMTAVETLAARMNQLNIPTPEQTVIGKILSSVPREYHVVGKIFEAQPKALQTLDDLRTRLAEEEDSLKAEEDKKNRLAAATRDAAASRDEDALAASGHYDSFARGKSNSRGRGRGLPGVKPSHPYQVLMAHSKVTRSKDVIIAMDAFILQPTTGIKQETRRLVKSSNLVASPPHRKKSPVRTVMPSSRRHALELSNLAAGSLIPVLQST